MMVHGEIGGEWRRLTTMAFLDTSRTGSELWLVSLLATCRLMGAFCASGLVIAVVTIATVGGRCGRTAPGRAGVAAAFSTRGSVFVVRTGVTVRVCWGRERPGGQSRARLWRLLIGAASESITHHKYIIF